VTDGRSAGGRADAEFRAWAVQAWPRLVRTGVVLTAGDHHLAEDLAQTTLTKVFLAWRRVRRDDAAGEHPDRYAHRVLVRVFLDETRRSWWRRERGSPPPDPERLAAGDPDPGEVLDVREALALLPPQQRAAVVLRHWLGYDVEETARLLGCTPQAVRSRTFRGLAQLRRLMPVTSEERH
jgi:RNA polymerase sigma-70 factor (sigma-E family)